METPLSNFNSLKVSKFFKAEGFNEQQAEALASKLAELVEDHLVTKSFLKSEFDIRFKELDIRFKEADTKLESRLKELEYKMTIKLGTMMVVTIGVFSAIIKLL